MNEFFPKPTGHEPLPKFQIVFSLLLCCSVCIKSPPGKRKKSCTFLDAAS